MSNKASRLHLRMTSQLVMKKNGKFTESSTGHTSRLQSAYYSPDGQYVLTASADGTARVWDTTTNVTVHILKSHRSIVYNAVYSPDGKHILTR